MEEQIFEVARAFRQAGGLFLPVFRSEPTARVRAQYQSHGLDVAGLDLHDFRIASVHALRRMIRAHRIGVVHWNFYSPINPYVWALTVLTPRLAHFRTDHGSRPLPLPAPSPWPKRMVQRALFTRYRQVFGISDFVVGAMAHARIWTNVSRCNYFVNTDRFAPRPDVRLATRAAHLVDEKFVVLLVGQLIPEKGASVAIRALQSLPESVILWIVGDGPQRAQLAALTESLGLGARVTLFGAQWNVEPFMQAADCLICPSVWGEGVGLVNLEGMASGLPVVASRVGGIPEHVTHDQSGLLVEPGDPAQLAENIGRLLDDSALVRRFGEQARREAVDRFSIERRIPEYVRAYER